MNQRRQVAAHKTGFDLAHRIDSIIGTYGGPETTQVFVHCVDSLLNHELERVINGFEKYPERSLVLARPDDIVCVKDPVDIKFLQFLRNLGVGPKAGNVLELSQSNHNHRTSLPDLLMKDRGTLSFLQQQTRHSRKIFINPFVASSKEFELASMLAGELKADVHVIGGNPGIVDHASYKHRVKQKAIELGIPVVEGDVVELEQKKNGCPSDVMPIRTAVQRYISKTGKVLIRGSRGCSGSSTYIVKDFSASLHETLDRIAQSHDNNVYLVEPMFDVIVSPNILMNVEPDDGRIQYVGITDQILNDNLVHQGNIYPSTSQKLEPMLHDASKVCKWLQTEGYSGLLGLDFAEYVQPETGELQYFMAEVNARTNAAVYSKSLMEHLNIRQHLNQFPTIQAFVSTNVRTQATSFDELTKLYGRLFFQPGRGEGLVPFNTGCLKYGKFTAAIFGQTSIQVSKIHENLNALLTSC